MVIDISWVEAHIIYICFLVSMGKSMESEVIDICFHGLKPMATRAELYLLNFIILCDLEGFTYEEMAKILDIPIGTVRSRLHRARNLLKEKLQEYASSMGYK
jgi:hypothetical protein